MKTPSLQIDLEKMRKSDLTLAEYCFLIWHKNKMEELNSKMILFSAKDVSEEFGFSESWARQTYKRLIRRGKIKPFKKYFEIQLVLF